MEDTVNENEEMNQDEFDASDDEMENEPSTDENDVNEPEMYADEEDEDFSFEDILSIPEFRSEYDRRISQAINSYARRHAPTQQPESEEPEYYEEEETDAEQSDDIESYINDQIEAYMIATSFENCLNRTLANAGIADKAGYLAHFDMQDLIDHYDPETDEIVGYGDAEAEMREEYPHYFGMDATGASHGTFGSASMPETLGDALREKYSKKKH